MPDTPEVPEKVTPDLRRHENYENWYSNNVQYQQSEWDLKLIFGQLDWVGDHFMIEQHTAVTVAWLQAKLILYFLSMQIGVYELSHGKIPIPPGAMPPEPSPPSEQSKDDPFTNQMFDYMKKMRDKFIAEQSG